MKERRVERMRKVKDKVPGVKNLAKFFERNSFGAVWTKAPHNFAIIDLECVSGISDVLWLAAHEYYHHLMNGGTEEKANAYATKMVRAYHRHK